MELMVKPPGHCSGTVGERCEAAALLPTWQLHWVELALGGMSTVYP